MTRYGMVIDLTRCFGCHACEVACKVANNNPSELDYNRVYTVGGVGDTNVVTYDTATGTYPDCKLNFLPMNCQHCGNPACLPVCPTGATKKDEETGVVYVDDALCIGCNSCIIACPYHGVRTHLMNASEYYLDLAVGEADAPSHTDRTVEKCTFCRNLTARGEQPACMQLCPGRARHWGDLEDPSSEVSQLVSSGRCTQLQPEDGTEPNIYYVVKSAASVD